MDSFTANMIRETGMIIEDIINKAFKEFRISVRLLNICPQHPLMGIADRLTCGVESANTFQNRVMTSMTNLSFSDTLAMLPWG